MTDILKTLRAVIWPERCIFCGSPVFSSDKNTCERCKNSLPFINGKVCAACGSEKQFCGCRSSIMYYDRFTAPFYYENEVRHSIHNFKFHGRKKNAAFYASYMADCVKEKYDGEKFDFITAVPMYSSDRKSRGYNQSDELASSLSKKLGIEFRSVIRKIYHTDKQSGKQMTDRTGNVFGVFDVEENLEGKSILLVDDIRTTGSTLSECGKMLYLAGAKRVCCVSIAAAKFKKKNK